MRFFVLFVAIVFIGCNVTEGQVEETISAEEVVRTYYHPASEDSSRLAGLYPWIESWKPMETVGNRIATPVGFKRVEAKKGGLVEWLRNLPTLPGRGTVMRYDGLKKANQDAHHLILNIDVGKKDLQQCADAAMRLRAEYLLASKQEGKIHFNFTSGDNCQWSKWKQGVRPVVRSKVSWVTSAQPDGSYKNFRKYMDMVYTYAGTASLSRELKKVSLIDIQPGDLFIQGGHPGHAVTVMDVCKNEKGEKMFLLSQSYMPAQQIHILINPKDYDRDNPGGNPWYAVKDISGEFWTPQWKFTDQQLMRFVD